MLLLPGKFLHRHHPILRVGRVTYSYHSVRGIQDVFSVAKRRYTLIHKEMHDDVFSGVHPVIAILARI